MALHRAHDGDPAAADRARVFSLELGQEDVGATPKSTTERKAYDLMASGFGVGYNGPLIVGVELGTPAKPDPEVVQQEKQAKSLQAKLESEQQQGEAEAAQLQTRRMRSKQSRPRSRPSRRRSRRRAPRWASSAPSSSDSATSSRPAGR